MIIKEIMNKVFVISPDITLKKSSEIMFKNKIGSLVIVKNGKILGIITERDVIKNINHLNKKISQVMSKKIVTILEDAEIDHAATLMGHHKIKRLPVVTKNNKLIGIVSLTDIIANSDFLGMNFF